MILQADARALPLADNSVQCVVTSPPYFGLRDYDSPQQIGREVTPDEYVQAIVTVFREVKRVLRPDGTLWLNMGDSHANDGKWGGKSSGKHGYLGTNDRERVGREKRRTGLKPKDLIGIPWRVAFALQADGWWLRSDNVWSKPNPMPSSTKDRSTTCHEYVFLLTRRANYYYDHEAVKERAVTSNRKKWHDNGSDKQRGHGRRHAGFNGRYAERIAREGAPTTRNMRSVWVFPSRPYRGAHFATFPPALPERCIKAGTPEGGCCSVCRRPYRRIVEKGAPLDAQRAACGANRDGGYQGQGQKPYAVSGVQDASDVKRRVLAGMVEHVTVGWSQQCGCPDSRPVPALVLDPFSGAGTTCMVAERLGRVGIGAELNREYINQSIARIADDRERRAARSIDRRPRAVVVGQRDLFDIKAVSA